MTPLASDRGASEAVLRVEALTILSSAHTIVRDLSFTLHAGERLGIVGESGSGKTMTAYAIAGLLPPDIRVSAGVIELQGRSLLDCVKSDRRAMAGKRIGMVLQDRRSSFNPVRTIGSMLIESAMRHRGLSRAAARPVAIEALLSVHLRDAHALVDAYPHQLSGGQLQRAMIALARLNDPVLLIADEPTTALDPLVQLQVLALLDAMSANRALLLITHDLHVAATLCDRLLVMHRGECIEQGPTHRVMDRPQHEYTQQWLAAARSLNAPPTSLRSVANL